MKISFSKTAVAVITLLAATASSAGVISKTPFRDYWNTVGFNGTEFYANSFVADETGEVSELGLWLRGGASDLKFQIYGSIDYDIANGPDSAVALASSAVITGQNYATLTYVSASPILSSLLMAGQTYWFAATAVGLSGSGGYTVGGHAQNSIYADNGSFWYSNASDGLNFDGRNLTPEMAFQVTIDNANGNAVPEPQTFGLVAISLLGLGLVSRRRS